MIVEKLLIEKIPAILWGNHSDKIYIFVHGKMSSKEEAKEFAEIAETNGYQTISFDLPEHGERIDKDYLCNIWNGINDLTVISNYVFKNWENVSLFACSIGAFFSLHAYKDKNFKNCLFQSPILDMEYLINQMFLWFHITEKMLYEKKEIPTAIDLLSWNYYQYVKLNPIIQWNAPTCILFGEKDNLQSLDVVKHFSELYHCKLTLAKNSEHGFLGYDDKDIVKKWIMDNIDNTLCPHTTPKNNKKE